MRALTLIIILSLSTSAQDWLYTEGNRIYNPDGTLFLARGVNIHDMRSCNRCAGWNGIDEEIRQERVDEVKRRVFEAKTVWKANLIRLLMESTPASPDHGDVIDNKDYLSDLMEVINYSTYGLEMTVLLSSWADTTVEGLPNNRTIEVWKLLATELKDNPKVIFGIVNEPTGRKTDQEYFDAFSTVVDAIREIDGGNHLIAVQGTKGWARDLSFWRTSPIAGDNIIYETHQYNPKEDFKDYFLDASETLPVIVGEFGPFSDMDDDDMTDLMDECETRGIPWIAWTFHQACPPNLIKELSGDQCGGDEPMGLSPTDWGLLIKARLANSYNITQCSGADVDPVDGDITIGELMDYIDSWKTGQVTIDRIISAIISWKRGC